MNSKKALNTIAIISAIGVLFSGYLTITEIAKACSGTTCSVGGGCTQILGLPTCAYGLLMYLAVFIIALLGIKEKIR